eukprot:5445547-Pyramimonas_sp.AAC.1
MQCDTVLCTAVRCLALRCYALWCNASPRNATSCYDMLVLLCRALLRHAFPSIAYPLGIIALLDIRLCEPH